MRVKTLLIESLLNEAKGVYIYILDKRGDKYALIPPSRPNTDPRQRGEYPIDHIPISSHDYAVNAAKRWFASKRVTGKIIISNRGQDEQTIPVE